MQIKCTSQQQPCNKQSPQPSKQEQQNQIDIVQDEEQTQENTAQNENKRQEAVRHSCTQQLLALLIVFTSWITPEDIKKRFTNTRQIIIGVPIIICLTGCFLFLFWWHAKCDRFTVLTKDISEYDESDCSLDPTSIVNTLRIDTNSKWEVDDTFSASNAFWQVRFYAFGTQNEQQFYNHTSNLKRSMNEFLQQAQGLQPFQLMQHILHTAYIEQGEIGYMYLLPSFSMTAFGDNFDIKSVHFFYQGCQNNNQCAPTISTWDSSLGAGGIQARCGFFQEIEGPDVRYTINRDGESMNYYDATKLGGQFQIQEQVYNNRRRSLLQQFSIDRIYVPQPEFSKDTLLLLGYIGSQSYYYGPVFQNYADAMNTCQARGGKLYQPKDRLLLQNLAIMLYPIQRTYSYYQNLQALEPLIWFKNESQANIQAIGMLNNCQAFRIYSNSTISSTIYRDCDTQYAFICQIEINYSLAPKKFSSPSLRQVYTSPAPQQVNQTRHQIKNNTMTNLQDFSLKANNLANNIARQDNVPLYTQQTVTFFPQGNDLEQRPKKLPEREIKGSGYNFSDNFISKYSQSSYRFSVLVQLQSSSPELVYNQYQTPMPDLYCQSDILQFRDYNGSLSIPFTLSSKIYECNVEQCPTILERLGNAFANTEFFYMIFIMIIVLIVLIYCRKQTDQEQNAQNAFNQVVEVIKGTLDV